VAGRFEETLMPHVLQVLVVLALLALASTAVAVLTVRWAFRRARRALLARVTAVLGRGRQAASRPGPDPLLAQAARLLTARTSATAAPIRACVPGPGREVALMRRDLAREVGGAARAVTAGWRDGRPVEGLASIVGRLSQQARSVDVDLAVAAAEPDRGARGALLAAQAERLVLIRRACMQVRRGVTLAGSATTAPLLDAVLEELDDEVVALGLRVDAYRELIRPT